MALAPFKFYRTDDHIQMVRDNSLMLKMKLSSKEVESFKASEQDLAELKSKARESDVPCWGIFGQVELVNGTFLILIESAERVGLCLDAPVFKVSSLRFVQQSMLLQAKVTNEDQRYIDMVQRVAAQKAFYFSYQLDLTTSIQRQLKQISKSSKLYNKEQQ
jgi:hypothetical protein